MASLKFYLDTRRLKADGSALLKISVTHSRAVRYISLGFSLKPSLWDSKRGRITEAHPSHLRLNNALSRIMLHAEDAFISVVSSGARYDLADLYEARTRRAEDTSHRFHRFRPLTLASEISCLLER